MTCTGLDDARNIMRCAFWGPFQGRRQHTFPVLASIVFNKKDLHERWAAAPVAISARTCHRQHQVWETVTCETLILLRAGVPAWHVEPREGGQWAKRTVWLAGGHFFL